MIKNISPRGDEQAGRCDHPSRMTTSGPAVGEVWLYASILRGILGRGQR